MPNLQELVELVVAFGGMAGIAALIAFVIDVFKQFNLVKDGEAPRWSAALNLLALVGVVAARYLAPQFGLDFLNEQAALVAQFGILILSLVVQLKTSSAVHNFGVINEVPGFFSHNL